MKPTKVLNLYAGIGGNRKLWQNVEVTAVELDESIATIYQDFFPDDKVVIGDAHQYLLDHYNEFDFIWSSPPCPTHSKARYWGFGSGKMVALYPDMKLYQEILFLKHFAKCVWVVENVQPYYEPLIPGKKIGRHLFWSNFFIPRIDSNDADINRGNITEWQELHGVDISNYKLNQRRDKVLRNCVNSELGLHIFNFGTGAIPPIQEGLFAELSEQKHT